MSESYPRRNTLRTAAARGLVAIGIGIGLYGASETMETLEPIDSNIEYYDQQALYGPNPDNEQTDTLSRLDFMEIRDEYIKSRKDTLIVYGISYGAPSLAVIALGARVSRARRDELVGPDTPINTEG